MTPNRFLPLKLGEVLSERYRILAIAGYGGMSVVYKAEDLKLPGKHWAVKATRGYNQNRKMFTEEAEFLSRLSHPHLPLIIDFIPPNVHGVSYLVMDYIAGNTLQHRFEENKQLAPLSVIRYAKQLCDLFNYLHNYKPNPIIYRDLKPSNVMVDEQDNIRLIDFGIARNYREDRGTDTVQLGTVGFAAPEQYLNRQTDERTDLYTLGAMMYYLLSEGRHYADKRKKLSQWNAQLPSKLVDLIHELLQEHPADRISSAEKVQERLIEIEEGMASAVSATRLSSQTHRISTANKKLVIIGGLYSGAGATTVAVSAARVLHHKGVSNAVIEHVKAEPQLESLLFGRDKPKDYRYYTDWYCDNRTISRLSWESGNTEWVPLPPAQMNKHTGDEYEGWLQEHYYRLFYELEHSFLLVDVGSHWCDPEVRKLCYAADCLVTIAGPSPAKWNGIQAGENLQVLEQLRTEGAVIHWAANPYVSFMYAGEWLREFPQKPILKMPQFPMEQLLNRQWAGHLLQDDKEMGAHLTQAMTPLLTEINPELTNTVHKDRKIKYWFKRKTN